MMFEIFRQHWKSYLGIHIAVNVLSALLLAPLATMLIGWLILASGQTALTDEDILLFALTPMGSVILLLIAALYATLIILQQAAMLLVCQQSTARTLPALAKVGRALPAMLAQLFMLALHMILRTTLLAAPFLLVAALLFNTFLTEFDINYYLGARPPVFWWAGALIVVCLLAMTALLLRMFSGWILALPLLVLQRESPRDALRKSRQSYPVPYLRVTILLLGIVLLNSAAVGLVSWLTGLGVDAAVVFAGQSLKTLAFLLGLLLMVWSIGNLVAAFFSNAFLNLLILRQFMGLRPGNREGPLKKRTPGPPRARRPVLYVIYVVIATILVAGVASGVFIEAKLDKLAAAGNASIIAHRGASQDAPENTLAAVEAAIGQGADWVEVDVQESGDGEVVVIHDSDLKKVGGTSLRVADASLAQLQRIDVGSWMDSSFSDQRIPTLRQLLELCKGRVKVLIELKYYGRERNLEESVARIILETGMQDQVMLMSLDYAGIRRMKSIQPGWQVGLLSSVTIGRLTGLEADFFAVNANFASQNMIRHAHGRDRQVLVWTVNDPLRMSAMMSKGVDGIITDKPGLGAQLANDWAGLELTERLIIRLAGFLGTRPPVPEQ